MIETLDALADILYVTLGAGVSFGLQLDKAFDLVHQSNMSKVCTSEKEAKETISWYKKNYIPGTKKLVYDTPSYKKSKNGKYWIIYNESSGKRLKSINYKPVKFNSIL